MLIKLLNIKPINLLALSLFGYPFFVCTSLILGFPTQFLNIIFRFIVVLFSLILIVRNIYLRKNKFKLDNYFFIYSLFWLIYIIKLLYEFFILKIDYSREMGSEFVILLFLFGTCILPSYAIFSCNKYVFNIEKLLVFLLKFGLITNLLILLVQFKTNGLSKEVFLSRALFLNSNDGDVLNPITISMNGTYLILISIYFLFIANRIKFWFKTLSFFALTLGLINLTIGASRGPFLALLIQLIFLLYYKRKFLLENIFILITTFLIIILFVFYFFYNYLFNIDLAIINRTLQTIDTSDVNNDRLILISSAINDFINHPIFGNNFVVSYNGFYPHNLPIEVLMSTGIFGGIFFFTFLISTLSNLFFFKKNKNTKILPLIFIFFSIFILSNTSGAIFFSDDFWIWLVFIHKITT